MTTFIPMPDMLDSVVIVAPTGACDCYGLAVRYYRRRDVPHIGIKVFRDRTHALARWRIECQAAAAGLGPPVLSPVRDVCKRGRNRRRFIGHGYYATHGARLVGVSADQLDLHAARIRRLALDAGLPAPTDIRRDNLRTIDGRVVLVDWGNDNTTRPVGRWRR